MGEFRWSDLQEEAKESLDELLANIRSDVAQAQESHEYPDVQDYLDVEIRQFERADEWVRLVWQVYCDTLARLGREYSDVPPITWSTEMLDFIDHTIEPLLETVLGVTEKEREFMRRGGITVQRLNRIHDHPLDRSTPWLKVKAAQYIAEKLKDKWNRGLTPASEKEGSTAPVIGPETQNLTKIADIGQSGHYLYPTLLDNSSPMRSLPDLVLDFQRVQAEQQRVQAEEHGRKMDFYYKELNRARELGPDRFEIPDDQRRGPIRMCHHHRRGDSLLGPEWRRGAWKQYIQEFLSPRRGSRWFAIRLCNSRLQPDDREHDEWCGLHLGSRNGKDG